MSARKRSGAAFSIIPDKDFATARLESAGLSARCANGLLLIDGETEGYGRYVLPGNNFHVFDFALFWQPVREDVRARTLAWNWAE